jgi:hypothetical protein
VCVCVILAIGIVANDIPLSDMRMVFASHSMAAAQSAIGHGDSFGTYFPERIYDEYVHGFRRI